MVLGIGDHTHTTGAPGTVGDRGAALTSDNEGRGSANRTRVFPNWSKDHDAFLWAAHQTENRPIVGRAFDDGSFRWMVRG
jgi:hypothetical protein